MSDSRGENHLLPPSIQVDLDDFTPFPSTLAEPVSLPEHLTTADGYGTLRFVQFFAMLDTTKLYRGEPTKTLETVVREWGEEHGYPLVHAEMAIINDVERVAFIMEEE